MKFWNKNKHSREEDPSLYPADYDWEEENRKRIAEQAARPLQEFKVHSTGDVIKAHEVHGGDNTVTFSVYTPDGFKIVAIVTNEEVITNESL